MTQRNNFQTADFPHRADEFAAAGHVALTSLAEPTNTKVAALQCRTRRAVRIAGSLPVEVRDQFGGREETRTQFLMARGAVLATSSNVRVGHKLTIQNLSNGKSAECHVISADPMLKDVVQIEVEFTRPQPEFWPVQFPAEDLKASQTSEFSPPRSTAPSSVAKAKSAEFQSDPLLQVEKAASPETIVEPETSQPSGSANDDIVSLADSLEKSFHRTGAHTQTYSAKTAPVDSVAQFRAANRAAHRRQQHMKAFYSFVFVVVLAGAVFGIRNWNSLRPSDTAHVAQAPSAAAPQSGLNQAAAAEKQNNAAPSTPAATPPENAVPVQTAEIVPPAPVESKPEETQIEVRHGSTAAALRKPVEEEEAPLALPLRTADNATMTKSAMLTSVMSPAPAKSAVLAPQMPKKIVPAKLIHSVAAQYPAMARQLRVEGEVILSIDVDAAGNVSSAKSVSGPPLLRAAAEDAVRHWKYQPATLGDKAVSSSETMKVEFRLGR